METRYEKQMNNAKTYLKRLEDLRKEDPEKAKNYARNEIKKMGLLDENGKPKEQIVTWD